MGLGVLLIPLLGIRVDLEATLFGDLLLTRQVDLLGMALSVGGFLLALLLNLPPGSLVAVLCVGLVVVRRGW